MLFMPKAANNRQCTLIVHLSTINLYVACANEYSRVRNEFTSWRRKNKQRHIKLDPRMRSEYKARLTRAKRAMAITQRQFEVSRKKRDAYHTWLWWEGRRERGLHP